MPVRLRRLGFILRILSLLCLVGVRLVLGLYFLFTLLALIGNLCLSLGASGSLLVLLRLLLNLVLRALCAVAFLRFPGGFTLAIRLALAFATRCLLWLFLLLLGLLGLLLLLFDFLDAIDGSGSAQNLPEGHTLIHPLECALLERRIKFESHVGFAVHDRTASVHYALKAEEVSLLVGLREPGLDELPDLHARSTAALLEREQG